MKGAYNTDFEGIVNNLERRLSGDQQQLGAGGRSPAG